MQDCFDYGAYWELLDRLTSSHRVLRFVDVAHGFPEDMFFILRHDVDYSTPAALALAEQESRRGIRATYFLLPNGFYYNLLDPAHAAVPRRLAALGHEVGLHYDVNLLYRFPPAERQAIVRLQISLLETLSGAPVRAIAMHQPGLMGVDPLQHSRDYVNAYEPRFFKEMAYMSDSCRAWRDAAWHLLESGPLPSRFQLALHPVNWSNRDRDRRSVFQSVHRDLMASIEAADKSLFDQIRKHPAVIEHEARLARLSTAGKGPGQ